MKDFRILILDGEFSFFKSEHAQGYTTYTDRDGSGQGSSIYGSFGSGHLYGSRDGDGRGHGYSYEGNGRGEKDQ